MPKNNCSCANDSNKEYTNEAPTFRTHYHLDNAFIPIFNNPSRIISDLVQNGAPNSLVDRVNCLTCDDSVTTQDKLKVRKKDRPTPYRVPYNHFRKVTSCKSDCITNVKINKDLSCNNLDCVPTTYALSRLVDKNGVRNLNNGGNYKNYLQSSGKNYYLNTAGILPECAVNGKLHTFKIGSVENTVLNKNSGTNVSTDCQLGYTYTTSQNDKAFSLTKMNTTTKKYSNPYHNTSGSVSSKAHIHKKKFRNILAGQSVGKKDGYNNCRNGEFCNLYMKPGPNTKLFMGKTSIQRCIPPRLRGMKQLCDYNLDIACIASNKYTNPKFQRNDYLTEQDGGFLKISFEHCDLNIDSLISITFLGATTAADNIFAPSVDTNVSSYILTSYTNQHLQTTSSGKVITEISNYTITNLIVNRNTIKWTMPVSVKKGTSYLTLYDGGDNIAINNTNGIPGRVYANVSITGHPTLNSHVAWDIIFPPVDCSTRNDTLTTSSPTLGNSTAAAGDNINSISIPLTTTNSSSILINDIIQITFYTTYSIGFFNSNVDSEGFGPGANQTSWSLNATSSTTSPSIKFENEGIVTNGISSAIWNGTTNPVNINGTTFYKQDLYITVGANLTTTSTNLVINNNTTSGGTPEINNIPSSPLLFSIKYQVSASCFTSTSISTIREILDICYYRQLNGTGTITLDQPTGSSSYIYPSGTFVSASVPNGTTHNPEDIIMGFTLTNENFVQGDVLTIDFYTSSSFGTGFFNTTSYPNGISNWHFANALDSYSTIPTILLIAFNSSSESVTAMANAFSSASWSGTTPVNLSGSIYYKQTLSITIGSSPPSISSANESYYLYIFRGRQTTEGGTTYTKLFTDHPTSAGEVKISISCNCFIGSGIQTGYSFGGPCSSVASNAAFNINATDGMSLADFDNTQDPVITAITTYTGGMDPDIVKFTFSLTHTGNQGLTKGDVIVFRITTDYGDQSSGFFTNYGVDSGVNSPTWELNKRPAHDDYDFTSMWLEQNGSVLDGNGYGIESINFANNSYNTNTNVYSQFLYVTIGKNITNISNAQGSLTLGIYANDDIITTFPATYNISYEIDSYCWTSTGNQSDISYDPCSGRSNCSLTNSSLEATGFGQETPIVEGGDFVRLCSIEFTATNAGLLGGDILILKLITSYTSASNTVDGFFTDDPSTSSFVTLNANGYNTNNAYVAMWISQGTTGLTPVSNMINSLSTTFSTTGSGATQKYIQTISITLSGTSTTTYGSAGTTWKINISGAGSSTTDITQIPTTAGTIDYQLDLNCFTGTGEQSGTSWNANPCFGRGGSLTGGTITKYPNNMDGGEDLEYIYLPFEPTSDGYDNTSSKIVPGDTIIVKIYTTPTTFSFFDTTWISNNPFGVSVNSGSYPGLYIEDPNGQNSGTPLANAITEFTVTDNGVISGKRVNTLSIKLSSPLGQTEWIDEGESSKVIIQNGINTASWINQFPNANGTLNYEIDVNCLTSTGSGNGFSFSEVIALSNLSLIPSNFGGYNNSTNGLGYNTDQFTNPVHTLFITGSNTEASKAYVALKFTHQAALSSGDTIKLTVKKPIGANTPSWAEAVFYTISGGWDGTGQYNYPTATTDGSTLTISSISVGTYDSTNDKQSVTITLGSSSDANSVIEIKYYDNGFNVWNNTTEEGKEITFDLEVTDHTTSSNNSGWFVQDISGANLETTAGQQVFKDVVQNDSQETYVSQSSVSNIIYRHYSAIPKDSYIYIYFSTIGGGFFDTPLNWGSDISNNALSTDISSNDFGISVREKDLNNNSTDNDISLTDFVVDKFTDPTNTNHPYIHYLRFKVNENGGITGGTGKYIEIYINDAANKQFMAWTGNLKVSIEVRSSASRSDNSNLLGSVYNQYMGEVQT